MKIFLIRVIFFITVSSMFVFGQDILTIEPDSSYNNLITINPTLSTTPATQEAGTQTNDVQDIRVFPSANPQSEIHISISKQNPQKIIISAQTNFGLSNNSLQGWYFSNNAGQTWTGSDILPNNGLGRGDPATAFDLDGTAYIVSMAPNASSAPDGWMLQKSTDNGTTWSSSIRATGPTPGFDKEMIAIDDANSSSYKNNIYCAWTEFLDEVGYLSHASIKNSKSGPIKNKKAPTIVDMQGLNAPAVGLEPTT